MSRQHLKPVSYDFLSTKVPGNEKSVSVSREKRKLIGQLVPAMTTFITSKFPDNHIKFTETVLLKISMHSKHCEAYILLYYIALD